MTVEEYYLKKVEVLDNDGDRIFDRPSIPEDVKKIHISAVCGKAMAPLAGLLVEKGYTVTGSDTECFPPMSNVLRDLGIETKPFSKDNLEGVDVLVVGNACGPSNPEVLYAREHGLPQISVAEALQHFIMHDRIRLVVAGTHGKTTTSGLLSHVFEVAGEDPGFLVGGVMQGKSEGHALGKGKYFLMEGDEYDTCYFDKKPKILNYKPSSAIVTSVEYDHVDIYKDFEDYQQAFRFFVQSIPDDGYAVLWGDDENVRDLEKYTDANVITYGFNEGNTFRVANVRQGDGEQTFDILENGKLLTEINTPLSGDHNILDITAVVALAVQYGLSIEDLKKGIREFKGMKKRQEVLAKANDIILMDDYAHHPTSVDITIKGLRKHYPGRRIVVLFEPRNHASRRKNFEKRYGQSLSLADLVGVLEPPFLESDSRDNFISTNNIVEDVKASGKEAYHFTDVDQIVEKMVPLIKSGDLVVTMSSGSFYGLRGKLKEALGME